MQIGYRADLSRQKLRCSARQAGYCFVNKKKPQLKIVVAASTALRTLKIGKIVLTATALT
jgi:hypothetical protein